MSSAATATPAPKPGPDPGPSPRGAPPHDALPALARWLGYGGLLPFVLGAALVWLVHDEVLANVTLGIAAYAGVIVSFVGALHWGLAMRLASPPGALLAWGVVPALVAWPAVLMPPGAGLVILGAMLVACYAVDRQVYPAQGVAHWLTLRFRLSAVGALSCFIAAAGS